MAIIKKLALGSIFISILCIFAMSHNANAINLNFENYSIRNSFSTISNLSCNVNLSVDVSGNQYCRFSAQSNQLMLKKIQSTNTYQLYEGEIVEFYYVIYNTQLNNTDGIIFLNDVQNISSNIITLNYELIDDYNYLDFIVIDQNLPGENVGFVSDFWVKNRIAKVYKITQYVSEDGLYYLGFGTNSSNVNRFITKWYQTSDNTLSFSLRNFVIYSPEESKENKEVEEKTQGAVDDSQAAGSGSSSSASQGGANLLSAITGFFNVITSAQPTNCRFNAPLNTYFGNQNLNVDLCALDLPQGIGALTSIIAIGILIPFAIHMFNKFISLFRSFQS